MAETRNALKRKLSNEEDKAVVLVNTEEARTTFDDLPVDCYCEIFSKLQYGCAYRCRLLNRTAYAAVNELFRQKKKGDLFVIICDKMVVTRIANQQGKFEYHLDQSDSVDELWRFQSKTIAILKITYCHLDTEYCESMLKQVKNYNIKARDVVVSCRTPFNPLDRTDTNATALYNLVKELDPEFLVLFVTERHIKAATFILQDSAMMKKLKSFLIPEVFWDIYLKQHPRAPHYRFLLDVPGYRNPKFFDAMACIQGNDHVEPYDRYPSFSGEKIVKIPFIP